jgi:hypothetical protein
MPKGYVELTIKDKGKKIRVVIENPEAIRVGKLIFDNKIKITQNGMWLLITAPEPTKIAKRILKDYKGKVVSSKVVKSYLR